MISKLEVGDLDLDISEFDIVELIENVFELLEMKAEKKKITLSFENYHLLPNYVRGDKDRIQQIIENLIVNSIKYGKIGGETEVAVVNLTKVLIRISDDGEGIEKQNIPRLLSVFIG
jgi:two-component system phosphate regulon sensor histidine kinase PhoR